MSFADMMLSSKVLYSIVFTEKTENRKLKTERRRRRRVSELVKNLECLQCSSQLKQRRKYIYNFEERHLGTFQVLLFNVLFIFFTRFPIFAFR